MENLVDVLDDFIGKKSAADSLDNIPIQHSDSADFDHSVVTKKFNAYLLKYRPMGWSHYDAEDISGYLTKLFDEHSDDK